MGEKERAEALLQAAGVTGVAVQESPATVTLPLAEVEALRAGAAPAAPASPEIPSAEVPAAAVHAATPAAGQLPEGILPLEELQRQERDGGSGQRGMSHAERMRANETFVKSAEYHMGQGQ
jgi:hypothetical protein